MPVFIIFKSSLLFLLKNKSSPTKKNMVVSPYILGDIMATSILFYSIFKVLLAVQFICGLFTFVLLFFVNAPYGKHVSKSWGVLIGPKKGWVLMEFPAFAVILFFFLYGLFTNKLTQDGRAFSVMVCFILIWEFHYIQRTFIYPFLLSKKSKPMALLIPVMGMIFNSINGFINGYYLFSGRTIFFENTIFEQDLSKLYSASWLYDPRFICGVALFVMGMIINIHSDHVLRTLRSASDTKYSVPMRGVHRLVANPNYLGEFTEWLAFALLTWSIPALAFAFFTFCNLAPRAYSNLKWYRSTFGEEYPKSRRAIIPFIF